MVKNEVRKIKRSLIHIDLWVLLVLIRVFFNHTLFPTSMGGYTSLPQFCQLDNVIGIISK